MSGEVPISELMILQPHGRLERTAAPLQPRLTHLIYLYGIFSQVCFSWMMGQIPLHHLWPCRSENEEVSQSNGPHSMAPVALNGDIFPGSARRRLSTFIKRMHAVGPHFPFLNSSSDKFSDAVGPCIMSSTWSGPPI